VVVFCLLFFSFFMINKANNRRTNTQNNPGTRHQTQPKTHSAKVHAFLSALAARLLTTNMAKRVYFNPTSTQRTCPRGLGLSLCDRCKRPRRRVRRLWLLCLRRILTKPFRADLPNIVSSFGLAKFFEAGPESPPATPAVATYRVLLHLTAALDAFRAGGEADAE